MDGKEKDEVGRREEGGGKGREVMMMVAKGRCRP